MRKSVFCKNRAAFLRQKILHSECKKNFEQKRHPNTTLLEKVIIHSSGGGKFLLENIKNQSLFLTFSENVLDRQKVCYLEIRSRNLNIQNFRRKKPGDCEMGALLVTDF